jgi:hypothetical protein
MAFKRGSFADKDMGKVVCMGHRHAVGDEEAEVLDRNRDI